MSKEMHVIKTDSIIASIEECRADPSACTLSEPDPDVGAVDPEAIDEFVAQYRGALDELALLDVDIFTVDAADLEALSDPGNSDLLAELIDRDPAYQVIKERHTALEFMGTRLDANQRSPGIPSAHYKRFVYLIQAGLAQFVDPTLVPNGHFGPQTRDALSEFQARRGIDDMDGTLVDRRTVDALVCGLRFDVGEIKERLSDAQRPFVEGTRDAFYINGIDGFGTDAAWRNSVRAALADAMLWVGALKENVDISTQLGRVALQNSIEEYLGKGVDRVGKYTIGEILSSIDRENPVVE